MESAPGARGLELRARVEKFIEEEVIPLEALSASGLLAGDALGRVREKAKAVGLWAPQLPAEYGGLGLELLDACPVFEAAGRSLLGPLALGCAAPDEGNAHLLLLAATEAQKNKYLRPLAAGEVLRTGGEEATSIPGAGGAGTSSAPRPLLSAARRCTRPRRCRGRLRA